MRGFLWGVLALSCLAGSCLAVEQSLPGPAKAGEMYWIFLNKGKSTVARTPEVAQKMQQEHVGNLGKLYEAGKLLMAGPLGDNGFIRGTVLLALQTPAELKEGFSTDPLVQGDYLAVEAYRCRPDQPKLGKPTEPFEFAKYTLVMLKKGIEYQAPADNAPGGLAAVLPSVKQMRERSEVGFSARVFEGGDLVGLAILRMNDLAAARALLDADPEIKAGRLKAELHPQLSGKGVLD